MLCKEAVPAIQRAAAATDGRRPAWTVRAGMALLVLALLLTAGTLPAMAQPAEHHGGEANLVLPNLDQVTFLGGVGGRTLLLFGIGVCMLGLLFGLIIYSRLEKMPVHKSMKEV
ncbi:MAG: sodium-translocating pyrophosphatase, partial [Bryobacteraceae bacterium]